MIRQPTLEELLASNPHIDKAEVERIREYLRKLRAGGLCGPGYRLVSPLDKKRVSVEGRGRRSDPRTIHLR